MSWHRRLILAQIMLFTTVPSSFAGTHDGDLRSLGGYPVCEASAAIIIDCPIPLKGECLLAGDNEIRDRLFLYQIGKKGERVQLENRRELAFEAFPHPDDEDMFTISDIEALVRLSGDEVMIFGSHSRNNDCKTRSKRRIFAQGKLNSTGIAPGSNLPVRSKKHKCHRLFGDDLDSVTQRVCAAIKNSEDSADAANDQPANPKREEACNDDPALNIEAAVFAATDGSAGQVWVGLRAPLVDGKAVVMRLRADQDRLAFDAVTFLDLAGFGIRELSAQGDKIWGISGSVTDSKKPHALWRFDAAMLEHGETIRPEEVGDLPTSAEGLAISREHLWVILDGADPGKQNPMSCRMDSRYIVQEIPE
ncbi:MAG: DUF3616 domain-containing protein [Gammaproteobacteria bacterium]|nr:DUF3616 domain-containing protein [Gammaproteobacteria bacterium]